jgi:hypothetical protein
VKSVRRKDSSLEQPFTKFNTTLGPTQNVTDALSRLPTDGMTMLQTEEYKEDIPTLMLDVDPPLPTSTTRIFPMVKVPEPLSAITAADILRAQNKDLWCQDLKNST